MVPQLLSILWLGIITSPIQSLLNESAQFHAKTVVIQGEVILEVLERGDMAWLNINDGTNAIGVYLPLDMTERLTYFGDHQHQGDIVRIEGIFSRNCAEHGGELDIHATSLTIIERGHITDRSLSRWKFSFALVGLVLMLISIWQYRIHHMRQRKVD